MIPIPIRDENPVSRRPHVTHTLIAINVAVWVWQLLYGVQLSILDFGAIPSWLINAVRDGELVMPDGMMVHLHQEVPYPLTIFTSMFMHGGWLHLIGNMWFLHIFGDNLEENMGRVRFVAFYVICGIAAALAQVVASPEAAIPMVGASGAIAGVMGGYIILHPHARIRCLWILFILITTIRLPAWLLLGLWFLSQFAIPTNSGVAWVAHVGGFIAGAVMVKLFVRGTRPTETVVTGGLARRLQ